MKNIIKITSLIILSLTLTNSSIQQATASSINSNDKTNISSSKLSTKDCREEGGLKNQKFSN